MQKAVMTGDFDMKSLQKKNELFLKNDNMTPLPNIGLNIMKFFLLNILLIAIVFFLCTSLRQVQAQSANTSTVSVADTNALAPRYSKVTVSPDLCAGAVVVANPITLHLNEKLFLNIAFFPEPENIQIDQSFTLFDTDKIDGAILQYAEALPDKPWIPQAPGSVTLEFQVAWHEKGLSPRGIPIIKDKMKPSKIEIIQITVNVVQ